MIDKFSDDNSNYKYESGLVKRIKKARINLKNKKQTTNTKEVYSANEDVILLLYDYTIIAFELRY